MRIAIFLGLLVFPAYAQSVLTGKVHVRDGDTIIVEVVPIRLNGVSAPERGNTFGEEATAFMRILVDGTLVRCELTGATTYDRQIGTRYLNGVDISAIITTAGLVLYYPRYSRGGIPSMKLLRWTPVPRKSIGY